jgi:hypothetical protein
VTVNVAKGSQAITFTSTPPSTGYVGDTYTVSATGGASLNPVTFWSLDIATCTVAQNTVTFVGVGDCMVAANQTGNASYNAAVQVTQTISVARRAQTISFNPMPAEATIGTTLTVAATGGGSQNPVTFTVLTPGVCALNGSLLSVTSIGACTVAADQAGNAAYEPAARTVATLAARWPFTGFSGLVAAPAVNTLQAGSSVSLTFSLGGNRGMSVVASDSPTEASYACGGTMPMPGAGSPVRAPGKSVPLVYDAATRAYTYTLKTDKTWANSCGVISLRLADGSVRTVAFRFK